MRLASGPSFCVLVAVLVLSPLFASQSAVGQRSSTSLRAEPTTQRLNEVVARVQSIEAVQRALIRRGTDLKLLLGPSDHEYRTDILEQVRDAVIELDDASVEATELIETADRARDLAQRDSLSDDQRFQAISLRSTTIPWLRARLISLQYLAQQPELRRRGEEARSTVEQLNRLEPPSDAHRLEQLLLMALVSAASEQFASTGHILDLAGALHQQLEKHTALENWAGPILSLLRIRVSLALDGARSAEQLLRQWRAAMAQSASVDGVVQLAAADVQYLIHSDLRSGAATSRDALEQISLAYDGYLEMATVPPDETPTAINVEARRRIAKWASRDNDLQSLPVAVLTIAGAELASVPETRAKGMLMLDRAVGLATSAQDHSLWAALFERGRARARTGSLRDLHLALDDLRRFLEQEPPGRRADEALDLAAACAAELLKSGGLSPADASMCVDTLRSALQLGDRIAHIDLWRVALATALSRAPGAASISEFQDFLLEAVDSLESMTPGGPHGAYAAYLRTIILDHIIRVTGTELTDAERDVIAARLIDAAQEAVRLLGATSDGESLGIEDRLQWIYECQMHEGKALLQLNRHGLARTRLKEVNEWVLSKPDSQWPAWWTIGVRAHVAALRAMQDPVTAADVLNRALNSASPLRQALVLLIVRDCFMSREAFLHMFTAEVAPPGDSEFEVEIIDTCLRWARAQDPAALGAIARDAGLTLSTTLEADTAAELLTLAIRRDSSDAVAHDALGESYLRSKDDQRAFASFREAARIREREQQYDHIYVHAWTRMLEILSDRNEDGSRTETIRFEIDRLKAIQSTRDFPEAVRRLDELLDTLQ